MNAIGVGRRDSAPRLVGWGNCWSVSGAKAAQDTPWKAQSWLPQPKPFPLARHLSQQAPWTRWALGTQGLALTVSGYFGLFLAPFGLLAHQGQSGVLTPTAPVGSWGPTLRRLYSLAERGLTAYAFGLGCPPPAPVSVLLLLLAC